MNEIRPSWNLQSKKDQRYLNHYINKYEITVRITVRNESYKNHEMFTSFGGVEEMIWSDLYFEKIILALALK